VCKDWIPRAGSTVRRVPVDFSGAIVNGLLTIVGYVVIFLGVYKVFQIATDIREIKDLVAIGRRAPLASAPLTSVGAPGLTPEITKDLIAEDSAAAYAEHLLRAVNAESKRAENAPHEVR
jgi:hypothetical protein